MDFSARIENFESMSAEEKLNAITALEDTSAAEIEKLKTAVSKANSEAAESKRKYNALVEEGKTKEATNEDWKKKYDTMVCKSKFLSRGYNDDLATLAAEALMNGDQDGVFKAQDLFAEEQEKIRKANEAKQMPQPAAGKTSDPAMTKDKFNKLSTTEQMEYINEHPKWMTELK